MNVVKTGVKSSTGCVHIMQDADERYGTTHYSTMCSHVDYNLNSVDMYYHPWERTSEEITCKRCLKAYIKKQEDYTNIGVYDKGHLKFCGLTVDSTFLEAKYKLKWGTYGKKRDQAIEWVRFVDCSTNHLQAILRTQKQIPGVAKLIIESILRDRKVEVQ